MEECKEEIHDMQPLTKDYRYLLRKDPSDDTYYIVRARCADGLREKAARPQACADFRTDAL